MWKPLVPDDVLHDVGRRLAELREERKLTQDQLATRAGVTWKYLQQIEAGGENLTLRSLVKFANLLEVPAVELLAAPAPRKVRPGRPRRRAEGAGEGANQSKARPSKRRTRP